jgi:hypothetical protein
MHTRVVTMALVLGTLVLSPAGPVAIQAQRAAGIQVDPGPVELVLRSLEQVLLTGDPTAYLSLVAPTADPELATTFSTIEVKPGATRAVIQERDRQALGVTQDRGYRVIVDVFVERGDRARIATWQLDVRRIDEGGDWRIAGQERLSAVDNLYRLSLTPTKQYDARDFRIVAEDLELTFADGSVFVVETDQGVTGLVATGRGEMRFTPASETEKGQVRLFAGQETLQARFDGAYIRAGAVSLHMDMSKLAERPLDDRELRRAEALFREESAKTYALELADLSPDTWSLLPSAGDFVAELRTRRFSTLTYARAQSEPEDISLFDRRRQRNIAVYASAQKLANRGRFYHEDDYASVDVQNYDIELAFAPERLWMDGRALVRLRMRNPSNQINLRLAEALTVHSVVSTEFGRLFSLRVRGQNTLLINLPVTLMPDTDLTLVISSAGRLRPQTAAREVIQAPGGQDRFQDFYIPTGEPQYLYSHRSYWYPQPFLSDYAVGTVRISVPNTLTCVATGEQASHSPTPVTDSDGQQRRRLYTFTATRPVRYLAFLVSRFDRADSVTVALDETGDDLAAGAVGNGPAMTGAVNSTLDLIVEANPLQVGRGRDLAQRAADIARFYHSLIGDVPYESFTLAVVEDALPGGHSPAYFAALNQPLPNTPFVWRTDPANFSGYPEFFLAHELAHQWWGQAVGWQNYHEQWLSEGFAQYFAALYARHHRGESTFEGILRQMRRWALDRSDQGPVYLGYRLGHVRDDSRTFRALIYNKGAAVLHMLRGLLGDDAFFRGLRRFYVGARFTKVGTEDLRFAMEAESGRSLGRFFDRWIYGSTLPRLVLSHRVETAGGGEEVVLRIEQGEELFDLPVTVTLEYADRRTADVVIPVTERIVETRVPLDGRLRRVDVSDERGALADIRQ